MKKLMVAVAIVCAAVMGQAAQFDWTFEVDDAMGTYDVANNATYFMIAGGETIGSDLAKILTTDGAEAFTTALSSYNYNTGKITDGAAEGRVDGLGSESYATIFVFNEGLAADSAFAYNVYDVSANICTPPASATPLGAYASDFGDSDYAASWGAGTVATAAVPEPTSGLLMLVGLAGLALRRRRA